MNAIMREETDPDECICPRCKNSYHVESEDYTEDSYTEECGKCGYKYHTWQTFSVTTHARPDCELNDTLHTWVHNLLVLGDGEYWHCTACDRVVITNPEATS